MRLYPQVISIREYVKMATQLGRTGRTIEKAGHAINDISKGVIPLSDDLVITSGYIFDRFQTTRYYKGQNPERAFWLEEKFMLQGHTFMAGLFFRNGVIYMLSLLCCDWELGMEEEEKRKELHDEILKSAGIAQTDYQWGHIKSVYDARSNISSIHIVYKM